MNRYPRTTVKAPNNLVSSEGMTPQTKNAEKNGILAEVETGAGLPKSGPRNPLEASSLGYTESNQLS